MKKATVVLISIVLLLMESKSSSEANSLGNRVGRPSAGRKRCDLYVGEMIEEAIPLPDEQMLEGGCRRIYIRNRDFRHPDPPGVVAILRSLNENAKMCETVDTLHLKSAKLGPKSIEFVSNIISGSSCPYLDVLYLANNNLGSDGSTALAEALRKRRMPLNCLNLGPNNISTDGAFAIANAIRQGNVLEELYFDGNPSIGRAGVEELRSAAALGRVTLFFGEGPPMVPGEAFEIIRSYKWHSSTETCSSGAICQWPSCRLLHSLYLTANETDKGCDQLSAEMKSFGIVRQGSADKFIEYLKEDPGGILALAERRVRAKAAKDYAASLRTKSLHAPKAELAGSIDDGQAFNVGTSSPQLIHTTHSNLGNHRHFHNHSSQGHTRVIHDRHDSLPISARCYAFTSKPHDYLLRNTFFYPDVQSGERGACADKMTNILRQHLREVAAPAQCLNKNQITTGGPPFGFGSMITSWVKPLMYALDNNISFWSPNLGSYKDQYTHTIHARCNLTSTACFFEPLSRCETAQIDGCAIKKSLKLGDTRKCIKVVYSTDKEAVPFSLSQKKNDKQGFPNIVPLQYRQMGHFWYSSMLLSYIMHSPNAYFQKVLEDAKVAANWGQVQRPMLSMHVRHGDSCSEIEESLTMRHCEPLSVYMETAVLPMWRRYGIKSIFLATDDDKVLEDIKAWPMFTWHFVPGLDRGELKKSHWDTNLRQKKFDSFFEAQAALVDLFLMAEGDAFVGKFTSNLDRIAFSLLVGKKQGLVPYASLDSPWCMDWGMPAGRSIYGNFHC